MSCPPQLGHVSKEYEKAIWDLLEDGAYAGYGYSTARGGQPPPARIVEGRLSLAELTKSASREHGGKEQRHLRPRCTIHVTVRVE